MVNTIKLNQHCASTSSENVDICNVNSSEEAINPMDSNDDFSLSPILRYLERDPDFNHLEGTVNAKASPNNLSLSPIIRDLIIDLDFNFTSENISHSTSSKNIQKMGPIFTNCDIQKMNININIIMVFYI